MEASSAITLPSPAVIVISGPIGVAPWETHGITATPPRLAATAPAASTSPSRKSDAEPAAAALDSPPSTGMPGRASFSDSSSASALNVYGSASTKSTSPRSSGSGKPDSANPSSPRLASRWWVAISAPGAARAHTAAPGPVSSSRPAPSTPPAPQPIKKRGSRRSWTVERIVLACAR